MKLPFRKKEEIPAEDAQMEYIREGMRDITIAENSSQYWAIMYGRTDKQDYVSILKPRDITDYLAMRWFADEFGQDYLRDEIKDEMALRVSIKGYGRTQGTKVMTIAEDSRKRGGLWGRLTQKQ